MNFFSEMSFLCAGTENVKEWVVASNFCQMPIRVVDLLTKKGDIVSCDIPDKEHIFGSLALMLQHGC